MCADPQSITSCAVAMETLPAPLSRKQTVYPSGKRTGLEVLCDFETDVDGGGWTIIQSRSSGPENEFYREWSDYVKGFGSFDQNFWLGLQNIYTLTKHRDQELRIDMEDFDGNKAYAKYSNFSISGKNDMFRLSIGGYSGNSTAGDSMTGSYNINGQQFSTKDKDNDGSGNGPCATYRRGAWWYKSEGWACALSNLNGPYRTPEDNRQNNFPQGHGLVWETWRGPFTSLKKVQMKIRKRN